MPSPLQPGVPTLVLLARRCHTFGAARGVTGVAIAGEWILAVGTRRTIRRLAGRGTQVVDLGSAVLTPGLTDCHTHFFYWALDRAFVIDVSASRSREAALTRVAREARRKTIGGWIVARGFDCNAWGSGFPSARDLDRAVATRPAVVYSHDLHSAWLNTVALQQLQITKRTADPSGGRYLRDERGRPTGILQEAAVSAVPDPVREFAERRDAEALRTIDRALAFAYRTAHAFGIVGVHSMDDSVSLLHLQRHRRERKLRIRVVHAVPLRELDHLRSLGLSGGLGDEWLRLGGVKMFADGALGSQTAYMFSPYPGRNGDCGVPVVAGEALREAAVKAARCGWATWVHAIGDRAAHEAVHAIAAARRVETTPLLHRIEHAQCVRPADIRRMAKQRIVASMQPCHMLADIPIADRHWPRARRNAYALRRMLQAGVRIAMGSDVPVESIDPRRSLYAAVRRMNEHGEPAGGWFPEQRISVIQALRGFTINAAAVSGACGTISPGAVADLTIWNDDPLAAEPERLLEIEIGGCVVGGQVFLSNQG